MHILFTRDENKNSPPPKKKKVGFREGGGKNKSPTWSIHTCNTDFCLTVLKSTVLSEEAKQCLKIKTEVVNSTSRAAELLAGSCRD